MNQRDVLVSVLKKTSNRLASALFFIEQVLCWVGFLYTIESIGRSGMGWVGQWCLEMLLMRSCKEVLV